MIAHRFSLHLLLILCCFATPLQADERKIDVDFNHVKGPTSRMYRACIAAGRVAEGLRADWQAQLKMCRDQIGFESLRCHGLLHDELGVYHEDKEGKPVYNFQYIDLVYDYLLSIGVRPFVEVGFMPNQLASVPTEVAGPDGMADDPDHPGTPRRVTVFKWKANVTPPNSWEKWDGLISALVQHWTDRYGGDEVKRWHFEIWNEPDHPAFFSPTDEAHRRDEYFELYAHTVAVIKKVDKSYAVGGPAGAGPGWVPALIDFSVKNDVPVDFISYHAYGNAGGPGGFDEFGDKFTYLSANPRPTAGSVVGQRKVIDKSALPHLPIHITEWSTSYSSRDPVHDNYISAPYILEQIRNAEAAGSMAYWTFTDIFEEVGIPPRPFHGGFGLINLQGIRKPAYFAYLFLNHLGDQELVNSDSKSYACRDDHGGVQILCWDYSPPAGAAIPNQKYFRQVHPPESSRAMKLHVTSLKPGQYQLRQYAVGFEKNDAYTAYLKLGEPKSLSREQVAQLKSVSTGESESTREIAVDASGSWSGEMTLRDNDVILLTISPTK